VEKFGTSDDGHVFSRAQFQKFIADGRVKVGEKVIVDPAKDVDENAEIVVEFPELANFAKEVRDFAENVLYEDENVVVVNKPAGVLTHAKGAFYDEFTVADFVKARVIATSSSHLLRGSSNSGLDSRVKPENDAMAAFAESNRPGIVHRLDRATSGVLIAAKNPATVTLLAKQFADRKAHKTYLAIVANVPKLDRARIDLPIARNPKKPAEFRVDAKGKLAITDYKILEKFDDGSALVELKPLTGRTHQLRVHLAHIGAPIVGDDIYNENLAKKLAKHPELREHVRMFLHAYALEITIPHEPENQRKTFTADPPNDFKQEIEKRGGNSEKGAAPWNLTNLS
jgi:23S rRNA pseudouridine1911/1915/1917 synthase